MRNEKHGDEALDLAFWQARFQGASASLALPADRHRTAGAAPDSALVQRTLPAPLREALVGLADARTPVHAWVLALWTLLLARLSSQDDLIIGAALERQPVVPLRLRVDLGLPVRALAGEIAEQYRAAASHARLPLADIARAAGLDDGLPFRAMASIADDAEQQSPSAGPAVAADLHLMASTRPGTGIALQFDAHQFDRRTAERLLEHFIAALASAAAGPDLPMRGVSLLTAAQRQEILEGFNRTRTDVPAGLLIHQPFEARVRAQPEAPALFAGERMLRYGELNAVANRVAHRLIGMGVRPGDRVGICVERGIEMVVGMLGALKAGAAYVPLDPGYPEERLAYMVRDCAPAALLTHSAVRAVLPAECAALVVDLDDEASFAGQPTTDPDPMALGLNEGHPAYVIYTSGSTGQPKGASVFHRGLVNMLHWYASDYGVGAEDRVLVVSSFSFDLTQKNFFVCLFAGGQLHLSGQQFDPAAIVRTVAQRGITSMNMTPSAFYALVDAHTPGDFASLRRVFLGGEPISVPRLAALGAAYPELDIINSYGPTECTDVVAAYTLPRQGNTYLDATPPIGRPICNTRLYVLDDEMQPVPIGVVGEIYIGGRGVGGGYLHRPELTSERFVPDTLDGEAAPHGRLYRTGDQGRWRADGLLDYLGRNDFQVKIRGFRVELGEVESRLTACAGVREALVLAREDIPGDQRLVAYLTPKAGAALDIQALRSELSATLADYMVPSAFVVMDAFPLTPSGKADRKALPAPDRRRPDMAVPYQAPVGDFEAAACAAFAEILQIDRAGRADNFFDLGGTSLQAVRALAAIARRTGVTLSAPTIFAHATPAALARAAAGDTGMLAPRTATPRGAAVPHEPVAIIGMAGRFPGAATIEALWDNLLAGRDGITRFTLETLDPSVPASHRDDPSYVLARGVIDNVEWFDNGFFGISAREAEVMDPQHRLFLELAWECLERAGYAPDRTPGSVGVFGGIYGPSYLQHCIMAHPEALERAGDLQVLLSNDKDYAALRVAHRLNLKGPAVAVHTSCSTSLVAIAQAVDNLRLGRCDMALAGGVTVSSPSATGYFHNDGSMLSSDGHTRTFDAGASGTIFNDGAAFVLLKPLSAALADGDTVYALIRAVATNNDGGGKASFTAPSVEGQAAVVAMAHREAGIEACSISYVEAHGTATPLGDPVELEALTRAFRLTTSGTGFCRIGSLKSNIGHLVTAAGAAGVIKTALALHHERIPASIHYDTPNPKIDFARSPFVVNDRLSAWPRDGKPRLAGVSNFGVGGTNAHAVLEEAPPPVPAQPAQGPQLLQLSARTPAALDAMAAALAVHLDSHRELDLADVAHTLQHGRSAFAHRLCVVADGVTSAIEALRTPASPARTARSVGAELPAWVWLFPGQGAQYAGMGHGLHGTDPAFRAAFDECLEALDGVLPFDLRACMFEGGQDALVPTAVTQPATFCLEYALARSWLARGARPAALIGHSVGEFAAAVVAGVMTLADAARLVGLRGALMQAQPPGSMLSVRLPAQRLLGMLPASLSLAADNGPAACVVGGPTEAVERWQAELAQQGIAAKMLQTSHAFHSDMMTPAVAPFEAHVREVALQPPSVPIVSTLTGTWMTAADATDPGYWARHLRDPVRFSPAVHSALARHDAAAFLEVGPRGSLSMLVRQHAGADRKAPVAIASLGDSPETEAGQMLLAQGQQWTLGSELTASNACPAEGRRRVLLPTYPFERKRFWLAPLPAVDAPASAAAAAPSTVPAIAAAPLPANTAMPTPASTPIPQDRRIQLVARLRELFEDIAGVDLSEAGGATPFVELGLDSLTLTQAALQVKKTFKVNLSFRQLMETCCSFEALAAFLDSTLPPEAAPAAAQPAPVAAAAPALQATALPQAKAVVPAVPAAALAAGGTLVQQVIAQQMQLMQQQLALLSAAPSAPASLALSVPAVEQSTQGASAAAPASNTTAAATATPAADDEPTRPIQYDVKKAFGAIARIHTQSKEPTDRQKARLNAFVRRYVERTARSKAFTQDNRAYMADPRVVNGFRPATKEITYQIVVERSKGSRLWDIDGNEYVDVLNGFGMNLFGWQPDFVQDAVRRQLDLGYEIGPQHPLAAEVTQRICELTGFDRAALCNTGSEAVMAAVRIARTVTGRNTVVVFSGSYHGTFDEVLVRAGRQGKGLPAAPGIMPGMFGDVRVLDYGTPESLEFIRAHADDLAAVLAEPVQSRRPDFQPREFLREVRAITEKSGTCLIFDEVITGFRSHLGGAQALFGIRADLASYGKVIGGGFPVGVIAGKREYMDALDGGAWQYGDDSIPTVGVTYFAGTFVRHPLALAACKASLDHLKQAGEGLQTQLNLHTAALADELTAYCREVGAPIEIRHFASLWRVTWLEDHPLQDLLFAMMRSRGVHILDNFPCFLTTAHTRDDIATIKTAFKASVAELQEAEFLPRKAPVQSSFDAARPPVPHARLGRDKDGQPAWFVPDPAAPGKFVKVEEIQ